MRKIMMIDIDGTVCEHVDNEYPEKMATAGAYPDAIERINAWHDEGHVICFFTARTDEHRTATEEWLRRNKVKHHQVIYNKPRAVDGPFDGRCRKPWKGRARCLSPRPWSKRTARKSAPCPPS